MIPKLDAHPLRVQDHSRITVRSTRYQHGPELRHLYTFLAVAERLSFRQAAEALHVAQPAISRTIRELEQRIDATLFDRDRGGVRLTPAGQVLFDELPTRLQAIDTLLDRTRAEAQTQPFRLGYSPAASETYVQPWLAQRSTTQRVVFHEGRSSELVASLRAGDLDACIVLYAPEDATGILITDLGREPLGVCLPSAHPLAATDTVTLSDLATTPLILFERGLNPPLYDRIITACTQAGYTPTIAHEVSPRSTAIMLVLAGEGLCTLTESLAPLCVPGTTWRPIHPPLWVHAYGIEHQQESPRFFTKLPKPP